MQPAIEIRNLGKQYTLAASKRYVALRDVITDSFKNLVSQRKKAEKFWALKDINLDIMPGERVGIIGRNGAGKSTLLKIISRITPPTTGEAIIRGRVGSWLKQVQQKAGRYKPAGRFPVMQQDCFFDHKEYKPGWEYLSAAGFHHSSTG
ncbi:MAG: ABC transporter ATP-binding protein [Bacteroidetes bacterium]|nr:ABC transporter ATP-binding protein [Bacteroidota bacterium]